MTHLLLVAAVAIVVCMASAGVGAADEVDVTFEGHFGGVTYAVAVAGDYVYIGQGAGSCCARCEQSCRAIRIGEGHDLW